MLSSCAPVGGRKHPEIERPQHRWQQGDWFEHDPSGDEASDPIFYGRELVEQVIAAEVSHEIGCHGFSHVIFGDPGCSRETAESEVRASVDAARGLGVEMRSFAFPRNQAGHLDVLREHGFTCFRGREPAWHGGGGGAAGRSRRAAHLLDVLTARTPPVVSPRLEGGLVNVPGSMMYFPMHGRRRHIPISRRLERMRRGVDRAVRERKLFHLWFHPTNLADETETMLGGLRSLLIEVAKRRDRNELEVMTMAQAAELAPG